MDAAGGLKLSFETAGTDDRRARFARVTVASLGGGEPVDLVTDAQGRLRYHLAPGEYRISAPSGSHCEFTVATPAGPQFASGWRAAPRVSGSISELVRPA